MLAELELEAVGENGSAPAGPPFGGDGEDSVGGFADGSAAAGRTRGGGGVIGGLDGDLVEGLEQFGGVDLLLRF